MFSKLPEKIHYNDVILQCRMTTSERRCSDTANYLKNSYLLANELFDRTSCNMEIYFHRCSLGKSKCIYNMWGSCLYFVTDKLLLPAWGANSKR